MSASYYLHLMYLPNPNSKLIRIDPYIKTLSGEFIQDSLYSNHSRFYFTNTYEKLRSLNIFAMNSDTERYINIENFKDEYMLDDKDNRYVFFRSSIIIKANNILENTPKDNIFTSAGYVKKGYSEEITNKYDDFSDKDLFLSVKDFTDICKVNPDITKSYDYIEFDDDNSYQYFFKEISRRIRLYANNYIYFNYYNNKNLVKTNIDMDQIYVFISAS